MASRHWCKRTATNAVITIDDLDIVISWLFTDINATSYRVPRSRQSDGLSLLSGLDALVAAVDFLSDFLHVR